MFPSVEIPPTTAPQDASEDLRNSLISGIMELTSEERKELLAIWKGRKANET